jgi:hypothetical protein
MNLPLLSAAILCMIGAGAFGQTAKPRKPFQPVSKISYEIQYLGQYESNIYHTFADSSEKSGMLNGVDASIDWKYKASRSVTHRASLYGGLGTYVPSKYDNRNTFDIGFKYDPDFRFGRKLTVSPVFDISRRSKNVIDDISADPARTLKKTQLEAGLVARYDIGKGRFDIGGGYTNNNYDEADTVYPGGAVVPLTSWDYLEWHFIAEYRQPLGTKVNGRIEYALDKRTYRERYKWGPNAELRHFTYSAIGGHLNWEFVPKNSVELAVKYTLRTDSRNDAKNNFYGYTLWQYGLSVDLALSARFSVKAGFETKSKDYPNYYTTNIGLLNRVSIDYKDFSIEPSYQLSDVVTLLGYLRNYDKTSNDYAFDYHDLTGGVGFSLSF